VVIAVHRDSIVKWMDMKKMFILVFTLALATSAFAAGKAKASYSGIIESYNAATKTLTVKHDDKQGVFVISDTSDVRQGSAKADASALTAGQKVKVQFVLDGATKIAQKVELSGAATKK
jgi:hypothetical protein